MDTNRAGRRIGEPTLACLLYNAALAVILGVLVLLSVLLAAIWTQPPQHQERPDELPRPNKDVFSSRSVERILLRGFPKENPNGG